MSDKNKVIQCYRIEKEYSNGEDIVYALRGIDFEMYKGDFVSIVGESGSGKTTLLKIIGGLEQPTRGSISVNNIDLASLNIDDLAVYRRKNIGFIFQDFNLLSSLNVYDNITLPIRLESDYVDKSYIEDLCQSLGIYEKLNQMPRNLSGGQQQRVAIARALATHPAVILADEPTGNLDSQNSEIVITLLKKMSKEFNQTMAIVTHSNEIAKKTDKTVCIKDGVIVS